MGYKIKVKLTRSENTSYYKKNSGDVIEIDFEEYLKGVVPSEIGNAHIEACKVQAVAARTYAFAAARDGKTISDESSSAQAYRVGRATSGQYPNAIKAVEETAGQVLVHSGKVINSCPYSASNGGKTVSSEERWGGVRAWLISKNDPWDQAASAGKKSGHGVGMSQAGAKYAAQNGKDYIEILSFYYDGCKVTSNYGTGGGEVSNNGGSAKFNDKCQKLIAWAVSKKGCKYVWGASGTDGKTFDCATFVRAGQKEIGISICAGASSQWKKTSWKVRGTIDTLPNCPCILYRENLATSNPMQHTGIYLGNNLFCDARGSKSGVLVNQKLSSYPWTHWAIPQGLYTDSELAVYLTQGKGENMANATKGIVISDGALNLRAATNTTSTRLAQIPEGAEIKILETLSGWYKVEYSGKQGYVMAQYIKVTESSTPTAPTPTGTNWYIVCKVPDEAKAKEYARVLNELGLNIEALKL